MWNLPVARGDICCEKPGGIDRRSVTFAVRSWLRRKSARIRWEESAGLRGADIWAYTDFWHCHIQKLGKIQEKTALFS